MRQRRSWIDISASHLSLSVLFVFLLIPLFQSVLDTGDAQALIYWDNKNGTANGFDWQNGGSDKGLFGDPILVDGNTLHFSPANFLAQSTDGISSVKSDRLQVDIIVHPGKEIQSIQITEYGVYDINSAGKVSASGAIFMTNLNQYEVIKEMFQMDPDMPISPPPYEGPWSGQAVIGESDWTYVRIVLNNNLIALSQQGSDTLIRKMYFDIKIITPDIIVPEPATLVILSLGSVSLSLRRRSKHC